MFSFTLIMKMSIFAKIERGGYVVLVPSLLRFWRLCIFLNVLIIIFKFIFADWRDVFYDIVYGDAGPPTGVWGENGSSHPLGWDCQIPKRLSWRGVQYFMHPTSKWFCWLEMLQFNTIYSVWGNTPYSLLNIQILLQILSTTMQLKKEKYNFKRLFVILNFFLSAAGDLWRRGGGGFRGPGRVSVLWEVKAF